MAKPAAQQFWRVPTPQRELFFGFQRSHPYRTVKVGGGTQRYIAGGEGERVLVFLHGALAGPEMWFYPILQLESRYRIIAPYFPPDRLGASDALRFLQAIYRQEKIERAVLIGMSYGGGIAQMLAEGHPEMVEMLVLSHSSVAGRPAARGSIATFRSRLNLIPLFLLKAYLRRRLQRVPSSDWNRFYRAYFRSQREQLTKAQFTAFLDSSLRFVDETGHLSDQQRHWTGETVLLGTVGDSDAFAYFGQLEALYPQARTHVFRLPGGHHMSFLFPDAYTAVLAAQLAGGPSPQP